MMRTRPLAALVSFVLALLAGGAFASLAAQEGPAERETPELDLLIVDARVLDGTGNPWFRADVGVRGDRIVAVGELSGRSARRTIDARGRVVAPGFIDLHSHAGDRGGLGSDDERRRSAHNLVAQGITTVVVNQDGRGPVDIAGQRETLETKGHGPNAILLVGHGSVRGEVLGDDVRRPATSDEVEAMRGLVRRGLDAGAWGLSAGLEYPPGRWSDTDEVVALVEEVAREDGVYISHERSESFAPMWWRPSRHDPGPPTLLDAVRETIEVGERTGATVVASHIKARGASYWGSSHAAISLIERARARGVEVFADQYPYDTSGSDGNTLLIPAWALGFDRWSGRGDDERPDFRAELRRVLEDSTKAAALRRDIRHEMTFRGGPGRIVVFEHPDSSYVGRSVAELARERGIEPVEMAVRLQMEGFADRPGGARLRSFSFHEDDIEAYASKAWVATASDAGIALPEDGPDVHARFYGTFPRKIRRYAIEREALSVEDAVRSSTSLPARILGLENRGLVQAGQHADLVILDLGRIRDRATFTDPHQYPEGVDHVLVNGELVVDDGEVTWALPGRVITREDGRRAPGATQ